MSHRQAVPRRPFDWARLTADLDRLNRILIPKTRAERERFRRSRAARAAVLFANVSNRFSDEGQVFSALSVLSAAVALDVSRSHVFVAWCAITALVSASLLLSPFLRLLGVRVTVTAPRRVTLGEEACLSVSLTNGATREHASVRVRGSFLPWDGAWTVRTRGVPLLGKGETARVELRARFFERGSHVLSPIQARALVPMGLALGPPAESEPVRLLVVPRIARVTRVALPASRRHHQGGVPRASHTADARELAGVRPYRIGDPVRDLHARTWARVGEPVVREYREEYFAHVGVVLDTDLGGADARRFEAAVSLTAGIVARCAGGEAIVEMMVLGRTVHTATLGRSLGTLNAALDVLACADPEGPFDEEALLGRLRSHLGRLSAIVFVTTRWDERRTDFVARTRAAGTACIAYVVAEPDGAELRLATRVSPAEVLRGEALSL